MSLDLLLVSAIASGLSTLLFVPWLIRNLRGTSLVGKDLNKAHRPLVPEMGGVAVMLGFSVGVAVITILAADALVSDMSRYYYVALSACFGAGVVGVFDDMFGLRRRMKAILPFIMALPLGAVAYASGDVYLLGVDFGVLIVFVIALGVTSAANAANMLEGFNGLGAGLSLIIASALILLSFIVGAAEGLFLLFPLVGALAAFLWYNRYPARIFPGDSMTLFAGATVACAAIISSPPLKGAAALLFLPMIIEFVLKLRGRFRAENYGVSSARGFLRHMGKIQSLTHLVMRTKPLREWQVVIVLWAVELAIVASVLAGVVLMNLR